MFQRKSLKLQCKKATSKKEKIIILHSESSRVFHSSLRVSSCRFLINIYEGLPFQKRSRQDHATHQNIKSLIYIFEEF